MNIRYPIYEGVYRILTLNLKLVLSTDNKRVVFTLYLNKDTTLFMLFSYNLYLFQSVHLRFDLPL